MFVTPSLSENYFCQNVFLSTRKRTVGVSEKLCFRDNLAWTAGLYKAAFSIPFRVETKMKWLTVESMRRCQRNMISQGTTTKVNKNSEITNYEGRRPAAFSTYPQHWIPCISDIYCQVVA